MRGLSLEGYRIRMKNKNVVFSGLLWTRPGPRVGTEQSDGGDQTTLRRALWISYSPHKMV